MRTLTRLLLPAFAHQISLPFLPIKDYGYRRPLTRDPVSIKDSIQ